MSIDGPENVWLLATTTAPRYDRVAVTCNVARYRRTRGLRSRRDFCARGARIARKSDRAVVPARVDYGFRLSRSGEPPTYRYYMGDRRVRIGCKTRAIR